MSQTKVVCAGCEKVIMVDSNKLDDFECCECGCDDYRDWKYRGQATQRIINPNSNISQEKKLLENNIKNTVVNVENKKEDIKEEISSITPSASANVLESYDEEVDEEHDLEDNEEKEEIEEDNYNIVEDMSDYIQNKNINEISVKYTVRDSINVTVILNKRSDE